MIMETHSKVFVVITRQPNRLTENIHHTKDFQFELAFMGRQSGVSFCITFSYSFLCMIKLYVNSLEMFLSLFKSSFLLSASTAG